MQIKKLKKLNKKVHAILEALDPEEGLNSIERDLIASYLLKMYAIIKEESGDVSTRQTSNGIKAEPSLPKSEVQLPPEVTPPIAAAEPKPTPEASTAPPTTPLEERSTVPQTTTIPIDNPQEEIEERIQILEEIITSGQSGKDLSDKLRMQPIQDINKAMSINERIFTVNELFGGNQEAFDRTIRELNDAPGFEGAKRYLAEHVMGPFEWDDPAKAKKLRQFLSLVQRKHLS